MIPAGVRGKRVWRGAGDLAAGSGVPRNFFRGGSTNSVEDRENGGSRGGNPLVRGSGGSCNLVQEISFNMVKFS